MRKIWVEIWTMRKVLSFLSNPIILMKKKILGLSAAILMICSLGVNSISAQDAMLCTLIPGTVVEKPNMYCGNYSCPDGTTVYQCNLRGVIIN